MRSVFAAMIVLSTSTAIVLPAEAQNETPNWLGHGYMQAPVGHRQPTQDDVNVVGANSEEENEVARTIERENELLDRELGTICRGC